MENVKKVTYASKDHQQALLQTLRLATFAPRAVIVLKEHILKENVRLALTKTWLGILILYASHALLDKCAPDWE